MKFQLMVASADRYLSVVTRIGTTLLSLAILVPILLSMSSTFKAAADTVDNVARIHVDGTPDAEAQIKLLRDAFEAFRQQKFDDCLKRLDQAHQKFNHLPRGRIGISMFFLDFGQTNEARQQLELAVTEQPNDPLVYDSFGRLALVEGRITDAVLHFERTIEMLSAADWDEARKNRVSRECEFGLATVAERRGQWDVAQEYLTRALDRKPDDFTTRRRLAQSLFHLDQTDSAYQELIKATDGDDTLERAEMTMARLYIGAGKHDKGEMWIQAALKKYPDDESVITAYASWLLDRGRQGEAIDQAKVAMKISPEAPAVKSLLGILAQSAGKHQHAEKYFQELSTREPANFEYSNQLVLSLIEQGDPEKSRRALQLAEVNSRQYPQAEQALATLGWVNHRLGNHDSAQTLLQKAISSGRASADTAYFYARVAAERENPEQDRTTWMNEIRGLLQQAIESNGRFIYRNQALNWLGQLDTDAEKGAEAE